MMKYLRCVVSLVLVMLTVLSPCLTAVKADPPTHEQLADPLFWETTTCQQAWDYMTECHTYMGLWEDYYDECINNIALYEGNASQAFDDYITAGNDRDTAQEELDDYYANLAPLGMCNSPAPATEAALIADVAYYNGLRLAYWDDYEDANAQRDIWVANSEDAIDAVIDLLSAYDVLFIYFYTGMCMAAG